MPEREQLGCVSTLTLLLAGRGHLVRCSGVRGHATPEHTGNLEHRGSLLLLSWGWT